MADQPQLLSPSSDGLDRAGWSRLGQIADATQSALEEAPAPKKGPNPAGTLLAEVIASLQRDWHRLWHPLESLREWWGNQAQSGERYREQGSPEGPDPTPPDKGPTLDGTWTSVRDQMFDAAKDPSTDPQKVAADIVSSIPTEHRTAIAERLSNLAEIARVSAGMSHPPKIQNAPVQEKEASELGEPPPQPLPESPVAAKAPTPAPPQQTKAKSR